jgi:hypothetical protein
MLDQMEQGIFKISAKAAIVQQFSSRESNNRRCHLERSEGPDPKTQKSILLDINDLLVIQALRYAQGDNDVSLLFMEPLVPNE